MIEGSWLGSLRGRRGAVRRWVPQPRRLPLPRLTPRLIAIVALVLIVLFGAWSWVKDSSLVAIKRVQIVGVAGPDARQIRSALRHAARNMTTLDVNVGQLRTVVDPYPVVKALHVSTQFPHGIRIEVVEQVPVAALTSGGRSETVAEDGTVLRDVSSAGLPAIPVAALPGGATVGDRDALAAVAVLTAAPYRFLGHITQVSTVAAHGLVVALRNGPTLYFGTAGYLGDKWRAAAAVLADPGSAGASYIDVSDPGRPAAGAVLPPQTSTTPTDTQTTPVGG